jgi:hypothetical protein
MDVMGDIVTPVSEEGASAGEAVLPIGESVGAGSGSITGAATCSVSLSLELPSSGTGWGFWIGDTTACSNDDAGESEPKQRSKTQQEINATMKARTPKTPRQQRLHLESAQHQQALACVSAGSVGS